MFSKLRLFSGSSNITLSKKIAEELKLPLNSLDIFKFSNDDTFVKINDSVRGADCFIIQSINKPVNDNMMELLITIDALKRSSAQRITVVNPYFGYARSDKKDQSGVPITAKLVADLLTTAGANRVVTLDLHADQIQGFFNIPVDHLYGTPLFAKFFKSINLYGDEVVVVSPDSGGAARARGLAKRLDSTLAIGDKRRIDNNNNAEVLNVIGDVHNKKCILFDDIIDTGGSLIKMADRLKSSGADKVYAACTHGVLSNNAIEKIEQSCIEQLFITDSIELKTNSSKIKVVSASEMLAFAIRGIHLEESINELFL